MLLYRLRMWRGTRWLNIYVGARANHTVHYLEQGTAILDSVARLVDDIVAGKDIRFRLEPRAVARLLMTVWESTSVRGVMAGLPPAELARHTGEELGRVAAALIER